jgi:hypothetical protein
VSNGFHCLVAADKALEMKMQYVRSKFQLSKRKVQLHTYLAQHSCRKTSAWQKPPEKEWWVQAMVQCDAAPSGKLADSSRGILRDAVRARAQ